MSKIAQEAASRSINSSVRPKSGGKATKRRARKSGKVLGVAGLR